MCGCWSCGLDGVADALGIAVWQLLDDPPRWLAPYATGQAAGARRRGKPEANPTDRQMAEWVERLWSDAAALGELRRRGLADATIRRAGIGYGEFHGRPPAFMIPVRNQRGGLLTLKERYWPDLWTGPDKKPHKSRTLAGRGSHLVPALGGERQVILCGGEVDALVTAQFLERVAVVTTTSGTALRDDLLGEFEGRAVAVIYDVGEEPTAERNAARLREAGSDAWAVRLPLPEKGDDLNDWWVKYGHSTSRLCRLIKRARRNCRGKAPR